MHSDSEAAAWYFFFFFHRRSTVFGSLSFDGSNGSKNVALKVVICKAAWEDIYSTWVLDDGDEVFT